MKEDDLFLLWYIPPHQAWLPPGQESIDHRFNGDDRRHFVVENACIEYGNNGKGVHAPLIISEQERRGLSERQRNKNCAPIGLIRKGEDDRIQKRGPLEPVSLPIKKFFPSDLKRPFETMLMMTGEVGITPYDSDKIFKSYVRYEIQKYPGRDNGDPSDLHIRPRHNGDVGFLRRHFMATHKEGIVRLSAKGFISFTAPVETTELASALFDIVDKDNAVVSTVTLPVFLRRTAAVH
jgi:hypothetical protein